jgi:hypothetical protein
MDNLELAHKKLVALEKAWILETRIDERLRLNNAINELKQYITELTSKTMPSDKKEEIKSVFYGRE